MWSTTSIVPVAADWRAYLWPCYQDKSPVLQLLLLSINPCSCTKLVEESGHTQLAEEAHGQGTVAILGK